MSTAVATIPKSSKTAQVRSSKGRTKLERAQAEAALEKLERDRKAAANKAEPLSAQHKYVLFLLLGLAGFMAIASFVTSFDGLSGAAKWAVGDTWLRFVAPAMFDIAILVFTLKLFRDREEGRSVRWAWFWIGALAFVSACANILHTMSITTAAGVWQVVMGCVISGSAPFLLALVSDVAADQVFTKTITAS